MPAHNVAFTVGRDRGRLVVDGQDWSAFVAPEATLTTERNALPTLTLSLPFVEGDVSGRWNVQLAEKARDMLVALGWTPPPPPAHLPDPT